MPKTLVDKPSLTRLADGRVLVAGGVQSGSLNAPPTSAAAVYNPATNTWTKVGTMFEPRTHHLAVLLGNGKVLVAGGYSSFDPFTKSSTAELFDPATGTFSLVGGASWRIDPAVETLANGKILVAGGGSEGTPAQIFDPAQNTWQSAGWGQPWHGYVTLTRLASGEILSLWEETARLLNASGTAWTDLPAPAVPRRGQHAARLPDGRVLIVGGSIVQNGTMVNTNVVEIFDPTSKTWSTSSETIVLGPDSGTLAAVASGVAIFKYGLNGFFYFVPATGTSLNQSLMSYPVAVTPLPGGSVMVVEEANAQAEIFALGPEPDAGIAPPDTNTVTPDDGSAPDTFVPTPDTNPCVPATCTSLGKNCGTLSDGCGGTLSCGTCPTGQTCTANLCTNPPACSHSPCLTGTKLVASCSSCAQTVCAADSYCCNTAWDSMCVNEAKSMCGSTCNTPCTPTTCAAQGKNCGSLSDGCGGTLNCGTCGINQTCTANVCTAGTGCAHSPCSSGIKLVAGCSPCTATVCSFDSYCCNTAWDSICVNEAKSHCGLTCP